MRFCLCEVFLILHTTTYRCYFCTMNKKTFGMQGFAFQSPVNSLRCRRGNLAKEKFKESLSRMLAFTRNERVLYLGIN